MSKLAYRQQKIQEKRKQTPWREFVMEICSWQPLNLYKRESCISKYPNTERSKNIVTYKEYETNHLNQEGIIFDANISFLHNLQNLRHSLYKPALLQFYGENPNCDFVEAPFGASNGYLSFGIGDGAENILYSYLVYTNTNNVLNSLMSGNNSSNLYFCKLVLNSYNIFYSKFINNSNNIWFSSNLTGCLECVLCNNLENQSYCINNKQFAKEEYIIEKKKILRYKERYTQYFEGVSNIGSNHNSTKTSGNGLIRCDNIENGYFSSGLKDSRNVIFGAGNPNAENMYDCIDIGLGSSDFYAARGAGDGSNNFYCSEEVGKSSHLFYCSYMQSCSFCLGCIGLKNKSYCILNKQYTKEERYEKVDEVFAQMEAEGTLGQFFPASMNPFYFNDTAAYLIDPTFTKEEVTAKGYLRRDEAIKVDIPEGAKVISINELANYERRIDGPDSDNQKWFIDPEILKVIIQDEQGNVYRIVKMEYDFLMKHGLPLPRKHRLERMKENFRIQ